MLDGIRMLGTMLLRRRGRLVELAYGVFYAGVCFFGEEEDWLILLAYRVFSALGSLTTWMVLHGRRYRVIEGGSFGS